MVVNNTQKQREFRADVISESLLQDAVNWISANVPPEEVYCDADLSHWAERNGYVKDNETEEQ